MKLVTIIAIGDSKWGQFALNCCLSIKAHDFNQKVALITDGCATKGIEQEIEKWLIELANCQWNTAEILDGTTWQIINPIIEEMLLEMNPEELTE